MNFNTSSPHHPSVAYSVHDAHTITDVASTLDMESRSGIPCGDLMKHPATLTQDLPPFGHTLAMSEVVWMLELELEAIVDTYLAAMYGDNLTALLNEGPSCHLPSWQLVSNKALCGGASHGIPADTDTNDPSMATEEGHKSNNPQPSTVQFIAGLNEGKRNAVTATEITNEAIAVSHDTHTNGKQQGSDIMQWIRATPSVISRTGRMKIALTEESAEGDPTVAMDLSQSFCHK